MDLSGNQAAEAECLGDEYVGAFLELHEPLVALCSSDVALVAMLILELDCF